MSDIVVKARLKVKPHVIKMGIADLDYRIEEITATHAVVKQPNGQTSSIPLKMVKSVYDIFPPEPEVKEEPKVEEVVPGSFNEILRADIEKAQELLGLYNKTTNPDYSIKLMTLLNTVKEKIDAEIVKSILS